MIPKWFVVESSTPLWDVKISGQWDVKYALSVHKYLEGSKHPLFKTGSRLSFWQQWANAHFQFHFFVYRFSFFLWCCCFFRLFEEKFFIFYSFNFLFLFFFFCFWFAVTDNHRGVLKTRLLKNCNPVSVKLKAAILLMKFHIRGVFQPILLFFSEQLLYNTC